MRQLSENKTQEEVIECILQRMKELEFDTSICSASNIERIYGEYWNEESPMNTNLYIGLYANKLVRAVVLGEEDGIPKHIIKQLNRAMGDGVICLYISAVIHVMSFFIQPDVPCDFYVGYVDTKWNFNLFSSLFKIQPLNVSNFHATVLIDNKVLDVCYSLQNEELEEIDSLIYGTYPHEARMWGWNMNHELPALLDYFASYSNQRTEDFIREHFNLFEDMITNRIDSIIEKASN